MHQPTMQLIIFNQDAGERAVNETLPWDEHDPDCMTYVNLIANTQCI